MYAIATFSSIRDPARMIVLLLLIISGGVEENPVLRTWNGRYGDMVPAGTECFTSLC